MGREGSVCAYVRGSGTVGVSGQGVFFHGECGHDRASPLVWSGLVPV